MMRAPHLSPMRTSLRLAAAAFVLLPLSVFALDYSNASTRYTDAPSFSVAERAGINVLTNLRAVEGNPDGAFAARRLLNRAEFTKIALFSKGIEADPASDCFPDVHRVDWFSSVVCAAKEHKIVAGNPDGKFHPERSINYAEAVTILVRLYGYELPASGSQWYTPFMDAAGMHDVLLPGGVPPDRSLTRGQMARLAAAFRAEADGELTLYRSAERGAAIESSSSSEESSSSSSSIASSSSSVASSSSSSVSSSGSSVALLPDLPARSHFLILGEETPPIASAQFTASLEPARLISAEVKLKAKIDSISQMYVVNASGTTLGQLTLDHVYDNADKTWRGAFPSGSGAFVIPKDESRTLAVVLRMKERGSGGSSEELVQVDTFKVNAQGEYTGGSYNTAPNTFAFPKHQTAQGNVTTVTNALNDSDALPIGQNQLLGAFTFAGKHVAGSTLRIEHLEMDVSQAAAVSVSNWTLGVQDSSDRVTCTVNGSVLSCSNIPAEMATITDGPRTLRVFGDVSLQSGAQNEFLQLSLNQPGDLATGGAVRWSDGSGHFSWTELAAPIARSTRFR